MVRLEVCPVPGSDRVFYVVLFLALRGFLAIFFQILLGFVNSSLGKFFNEYEKVLKVKEVYAILASINADLINSHEMVYEPFILTNVLQNDAIENLDDFDNNTIFLV